MTARQCGALLVAVIVSCTAVAFSGNRSGKDLPPGGIALSGAGATFPAPLYKKWLEVYRTRHPQVLVSYDPIGTMTRQKQRRSRTMSPGA